MTMEDNRADIYKPIQATRVGPSPLVIRAVVTNNNNGMVEGVPQAALKVENYVLVSALPRELQERVRTAVQAIIDGM